jgi:hypothetical protein
MSSFHEKGATISIYIEAKPSRSQKEVDKGVLKVVHGCDEPIGRGPEASKVVHGESTSVKEGQEVPGGGASYEQKFLLRAHVQRRAHNRPSVHLSICPSAHLLTAHQR